MRSTSLIGRRRLPALTAVVLAWCAITVVLAGDAHSAFSGANGKIVFASDRDGEQDVYVMHADGTNQTRLTNAPGDDQYPFWSPDGTKIAFSSFRQGNQKLFTMNADGSAQARLIDTLPTGGGDEEPAWSRNGARLAFRSDRELDDQHIWTVNANGTGLARLTNVGTNINPVWAPGTDTIAFASNRDGDFEIYTMDAFGQNVIQRTTNDAFDSNPDWSGGRIAFQSNIDGDFDIYVLNQDGSIGQLTNDPAFDSSPAWSPDGTKVAFQSNRDGDFEIFTMNADGSGVQQLTHNTAVDRVADWQPLTSGGGDTTPPLINLPGPITVNATSRAGAPVSFAVQVSDVVDPSPSLTCSHASGATFPIGSTTVSCTASDRAGNTSRASLVVTVLGAKEQIESLLQKVIASSVLNATQKAFLTARLRAALAGFDPSRPGHQFAACNATGLFSIVVSSLSGRGIPPAVAAAWLADARRIRDVLHC